VLGRPPVSTEIIDLGCLPRCVKIQFRVGLAELFTVIVAVADHGYLGVLQTLIVAAIQ